MNKRLSSLTALLLAALLLLAGCGKTPSASVPASSAPASSPSSDPASAPTGPTEPAAPAVPDLSKLDLPTFPDRNIYFSQCGDNLLLLYILPGLDASQTAVVHVSLSQNKVLGTYDLGEGNFYVTATQKPRSCYCIPTAPSEKSTCRYPAPTRSSRCRETGRPSSVTTLIPRWSNSIAWPTGRSCAPKN